MLTVALAVSWNEIFGSESARPTGVSEVLILEMFTSRSRGRGVHQLKTSPKTKIAEGPTTTSSSAATSQLLG